MEADFWLDRWAEGQIGFHEPAAHTMLLRHWPGLSCVEGSRVFVPLCGKSLDMVWLADQGYRVLGVEIAELAIRDFFSECGLDPERTELTDGRAYGAGPYRLLGADLFALRRQDIGGFSAIYDRAALIALPPDMRAAYAARVTELSEPGTAMLLITVGYDPEQVKAPPFAVSDNEVQALYAADWTIERLDHAAADVKGQPGTETVFRLTRS